MTKFIQWLKSLFGINSDKETSNKGNISSSGEKIYYVEGGQYYSRTKISPQKVEKWFCSEREVFENGWRKSKR